MIAHPTFAQGMLPPVVLPPSSQSGGVAPTSADDGEIAQRIAQLIDRQSDAATRSGAAAALLASDDPQAIAALVHAVERDDPAGARLAVVGAIPACPSPPPQLLNPLLELLFRPTSPDRVVILTALGRYRTREAVAGVVRVIDPASGEDATLVAVGIATLKRQTGRTFTKSADWMEWWNRATRQNSREWFEGLAVALGDMAAASERRNTDLVRRLTDSYRRLHALMPETERSAFITELIASDSTELCLLGFDLAKRALLNARTLDARVGDAAIRRLADRSPLVRAEAASLISRLDQPHAGSALAIALSAEQDPTAAASILRAVAREPVPRAAQDVVHWLENGDQNVAAAAAEAALALRQAGHLSDPDLVTRCSDALRKRPADQLTPAGAALLTLIGEEEVAIALLGTARPDVADAVAAALVEIPDGVDPLVNVARSRPRLAPAAIQALAQHRPTAEGFTTGSMLCSATDENAHAALTRYAQSLPPTELLTVARSEVDAVRRAEYLARVPTLAATNGNRERPEIADLVLLLARTQLELRDPSSALETMSVFNGKHWADKFDPLRVTAMLWLFRLPQAEEVSMRSNVSPSHWLDGLEYAIDLPYAIDIADQIRRVFGESLNDDDRTRLEQADRYIQSDLGGPPVIVN